MTQDLWSDCYQLLSAYPPERTATIARRTIRRQWLSVVGSDVDLDVIGVDADVHLITALAAAYNRGWFDAVLGSFTTKDVNYWPFSLVSWARDDDHGPGRAFGRKTKGELLAFFGRFAFSEVLTKVAQADRIANIPAQDRMGEAVHEICRLAWHSCTVFPDREAWYFIDDAPWYDYLDLPERLGWLAAALNTARGDILLRPAEICDQAQALLERTEDLPDWLFKVDAVPTEIESDLTRILRSAG